jgi:LysR family hca operon transcriptional activator
LPLLDFPSDHRLAARSVIKLREIEGEPFIKPSKTAPTLRKTIEDSLKRAGLDIHANHEVQTLPTPSR